ncbi:hypothetical protein NM688_g8348 [Phlebia brevispora]|uniref:Uncharacterized protein n=1 Tax=Phlebia brevispora TaxID=194682 RepID=A0ACC1RTW3_9APHY|nr:hypothetical protein NM688_g8348 [Phlebia brevispora]
MATAPKFPPLDGSLPVLPGFVDFHAKYNPDLPWVVFPSKQDPTKADSISYSQFAKATHRIAHGLRPNRSEGKDGDVVGVVIHCDSILYLAVLVGLVRAGFVPFPMSPRNSPEAIYSMLEKTNSHRVVSQSSLAPLISKVRGLTEADSYTLQVDEMPSLQSVFPFLETGIDTDVEPYPASSRPHHPDDLVVYIHSSGSTGYPKPIPQRQKQVLNWCSSAVITKGRDRAVRWACMHLPTFHTIGFYMQLYSPLVSGYAIAVFAPQAPASPIVPNPRNVLEAARVTGCTGVPTVPAFVEAWAQSEDAIKFLTSLQIVAFSGGPLSEKNGNKLAAAGVKFFAVYGATEFGAYTDVFDADDSQGPDAPVKTSADWAWFSFCDRVKPRWIPQGDGSYELQFLTWENHHPAIENLPDVRGYATSDLFEPHPTKKGLWKITGRKDDVLVLGSGEKIVPLPQEGMIGSHPKVAGAVMFGRGRNEPGILIELHPEDAIDPRDETAVIHFRNEIWPIVEEANRTAPAFARIFKEMIIVADPARPFPRAAKGTFIRKQTIALYQYEIDQLYDTVDDSRDTKGIAPPASWIVEDIETWLMEHASAIKDSRIDPSVDLFDQGFDSLYTTFLRNRIIGAMRTSDDPNVRKASATVPQNFIFDHPTLRELAAGIAALINPVEGPQHKDHVKDIQDMLAKYSKNMPTYKQEIVVLLTGSTGNVGCHALASLLSEPRVTKVYTFNRPSANGGNNRQKAAFASRNLPVELLDSPKLVPLVGDLAIENFGLDKEVFAEIKGTVTHIIHNAWKVDFNHTLPSFESHIANTRKLLDECFTFARRPRVLFTSSIAAVQGWDVSRGLIPEEPLSDPALAIANGYGSSKYVAEQVCLDRNGGIMCFSDEHTPATCTSRE